SSKSILAIGAVMVDVVCHIPQLPERGEGVVVGQRDTLIGGCAFNSGNIIRQLGRSVYLFAPIGKGIFADFAEKALTERGLEALHIDTNLDNGSCTCLVEPDGERTMITSPGIERCFESSWFDAIDPSQFSHAFAGGYEIEGAGGEAIISFLEANPSIEFFYAPGPRITGVGSEKTTRINALRPIWHLNDLEALSYTGCATLDAAARMIVGECGSTVVVTEGSKGAHVFSDDGHLLVPSDPIDPIDTVGAGDAHLGALIAARNAGLGWEQALALANNAAKAVCLVSGGSLSDEEFTNWGISI
ncbi:MAG: PfkB family carbohydrate kinase, partial [Raoultibacter sp.]